MNTRLIRFALIALLLTYPFAGSALAQNTKEMVTIRQPVAREYNPAFKGKPEQEIEDLEHQFSDAIRTKDATKLSALLADEIIFDSLQTKKTVFIKLLQSSNANYYSMEKSGMQIRFSNNEASVTGIRKSEIEIKDGSELTLSNFSTKWERINGVWLCVEFR